MYVGVCAHACEQYSNELFKMVTLLDGLEAQKNGFGLEATETFREKKKLFLFYSIINRDNAASEGLDCIMDHGLVIMRGRMVCIYSLPTAAWEGAQEEA